MAVLLFIPEPLRPARVRDPKGSSSVLNLLLPLGNGIWDDKLGRSLVLGFELGMGIWSAPSSGRVSCVCHSEACLLKTPRNPFAKRGFFLAQRGPRQVLAMPPE